MSLKKLAYLVGKRFNPNQPRWPEGSGDKSGEWMPANMTVAYAGPNGRYVGRERRKAPRIQSRGLSSRERWTEEERARFRATGSPFARKGIEHSSSDILTALAASVARARENWKDTPIPAAPAAREGITYKGKAALRWASKTGSVRWTDEVSAIVGEGKAASYALKGDSRRGFYVDVISGMPTPEGAVGLLTDADGTRVKYVERSDAQDAAREYDECLAQAMGKK